VTGMQSHTLTTGQTENVATGVVREPFAKMISIVSMATLVFGALLINPQGTFAGMSVAQAETRAIEMVPVCKEHFKKFEKWNEYYKVFAYGPGIVRAGCASARSEGEAIAKCEKALDAWGVKCRVYAKSPVNGGLAIVWKPQNQLESSSRKHFDLQTLELCSRAVKYNGRKAVWDITKSSHLAELIQRNISLRECARLARQKYKDNNQVVSRTHSTATKYSNLPNVELCLSAMRFEDQKAVWDVTKSSQLAELIRQNISLRDCARLTKKNHKNNLQIAREARDRKQKIEAERKRQQAEVNRKAEQERVRIAEATIRRRLSEAEQTKKDEEELSNRLAAEHNRRVVVAHELALAPLRSKNKHSVAVIIGNKNYDGRTPAVDFAHNDADAMRKFVLERLAYRDGNIIDLRDASRNRIAAVFGNERNPEGELFSIIREGKSDVIVYYSGHGVPGLKDKRPYLLPVNGDPNLAEITGYPVDTLYKNLAKLSARSVTVFLDACFSGDSDKGMLISSASGLSLEPELPSASSRLTVVTAAQGNQLASWDPKARHGLFTKHLLDALNGRADDQEYGNADGKVSLSEVQTYLDDEMTYQARRTWNRRQNAYVRGSGNHVLASVFSLPELTGGAADIEEMDAMYTVLKTANLRAGPSTNTSVVGKLRAGSSVNVTGKVSGRNWYRLDDGSFVFGSLVEQN
jgi:hypothetical protein